jgi:hypothetical protein
MTTTINLPSKAIGLSSRAKMLALAAHELVDQTRKYGVTAYGPERYYFHPCRVAELVASVGCGEEVIAAAALHDVLEDVSPVCVPTLGYFNAEWLYKEFGERVFTIVVECTNVYSKDAGQRAVLTDAVDILKRIGAPLPEYACDLPALWAKVDGMNRGQRKLAEAVRYRDISSDAKIIKRADLFDNAGSMSGAPSSFVKTWMEEKAVIESYIGDWETYAETVKSRGLVGAAS